MVKAWRKTKEDAQQSRKGKKKTASKTTTTKKLVQKIIVQPFSLLRALSSLFACRLLHYYWRWGYQTSNLISTKKTRTREKKNIGALWPPARCEWRGRCRNGIHPSLYYTNVSDTFLHLLCSNIRTFHRVISVAKKSKWIKTGEITEINILLATHFINIRFWCWWWRESCTWARERGGGGFASLWWYDRD